MQVEDAPAPSPVPVHMVGIRDEFLLQSPPTHYKRSAAALEKAFRTRVDTFYKTYHSEYRNFHLIPSLQPSVATEETLPSTSSSSSSLCKKSYDLLILVNSKPENVKRRLAIRYSWADYNLNNNGSSTSEKKKERYKVLFTLGTTEDLSIKHMVNKENEQYQDIVVMNIKDSYGYLSQKTMLSLKWVNEYCKPVFLLKTDDDCFVNIPSLMGFLQRQGTADPLYVGRVQWGMPAIRDRSSKFFVPVELYGGFLYPPYAAGGGYVISGETISQLLKASLSQHAVIPIEDVNIGYLLSKIDEKIIRPIDNKNFLPFIYCNVSIWERPPCDYVEPYVMHGVDEYGQLWLHYHVQVLESIPSICRHANKHRHQFGPPLYCPVNLAL